MRTLSILKGGLFFIFLLITLLITNIIQVISLILIPVSPPLFRALNRYMADRWWAMFVVMSHLLYGYEINITGDDLPDHENALVLCNHQSIVDIPIIFEPAWKHGRLGDLKWFIKDIVKYFPAVGWGLGFLDNIFIKRDWTRDEGHVKRVFEKIIKHRASFWIVLFPEGTRRTGQKQKLSEEYAEKQGLKATKNVLIPRTKGFIATLKALEGHLDAVYDFTIRYHSSVPTLADWFFGRFQGANLHIKRYSVRDLPKSEQALIDWLRNIYVDKDPFLQGS